MAERATIFQTAQIGLESTAGTAVPANKLLQALSVDTDPQIEVATFRPSGQKYVTVAAPGKDFVQASLGGIATYTEIIYPLSSVLTQTTPSTVDTTAKLWTFNPSSTAADNPATFSIEQGSAVRAHKFNYAIVDSFGITFSRKEIKLDGSLLGRGLTDGATMTASPTALALVPVLPTQVQVFLAASQTGLAGATALTRAITTEIKIDNRYKPVWSLDSSQTSYAATVETEPKVTAKLKVEADATGMALLPTMRAGTTQFMRIKAIGGIIGSTTATYLLQVDLAAKISNIAKFSDEDGLYAIEWEFTAATDPTWGQAYQFQCQNLLATL